MRPGPESVTRFFRLLALAVLVSFLPLCASAQKAAPPPPPPPKKSAPAPAPSHPAPAPSVVLLRRLRRIRQAMLALEIPRATRARPRDRTPAPATVRRVTPGIRITLTTLRTIATLRLRNQRRQLMKRPSESSLRIPRAAVPAPIQKRQQTGKRRGALRRTKTPRMQIV